MKPADSSRSTLRFAAALLLLTALVSALLMSGCSMAKGGESGRNNDASYYSPEEMNDGRPNYNSVPGAEAPTVPGGEQSANDRDESLPEAPAVLSEEKLVYTCDMTVETTKYKETAAALKARVREFGGIVESENETDTDNTWYYSNHTRYSASMKMYLTVRIPSEHYSEFVESAGSLGKVRQKSQNVQNISRRYSDTKARILALETEETRLLEMLRKAETVEEMLFVEKRLTEVEYELSSQRSALSGMDVDVAYSTINISLIEVLEYTEEERPAVTFLQRVGNAFSGMWEGLGDFGEGFVIVLIYLIPLFVLAGAVLLIIFVIRKVKDKKHPERVAARKARKEARMIRKYGTPIVTEKDEKTDK